MQLRPRGSAAPALAAAFLLGPLLVSSATFGCAHHRADQYSYAPPYAPPVYPQPQAPTQTEALPAAVAALPAGAVPAATVASPTLMNAAAAPSGEVVVAAGSPCPPCASPGMEGVVVGATALIEGGGQTPPCPPGQ